MRQLDGFVCLRIIGHFVEVDKGPNFESLFACYGDAKLVAAVLVESFFFFWVVEAFGLLEVCGLPCTRLELLSFCFCCIIHIQLLHWMC